MKKLSFALLALFLFIGFKAVNFKTISGSVSDQLDGSPIVMASLKSLPSKTMAQTNREGKFNLKVPESDTELQVTYIGYGTKTIKYNKSTTYKIQLSANKPLLEEVMVVGPKKIREHALNFAAPILVQDNASYAPLAGKISGLHQEHKDTESYSSIVENGFKDPLKDALSTFSIDVDAASYSNVRRFINNGSLPPKDAVRIEEMINYFDYNYAQPTGKDPINIITELAPAPWNPQHRLVQIGLKAKTIATDNLPASNLVFLIDVSGSMNSANKLPLLVSSFKLLTDQLRVQDKVAIVVYAGQSGLVLPSTPGDAKTSIKDALNKLSAGGSTAGGAGLQLAYKVASENFIKGGNNRIILATDGDFNVGASSDDEMQKLIEQKRKSGIFLTVLGYGMGNYKDSKMEILANKGNGNYAYIDNINEARKILVNEFGGTLFTIAKDVKLQVEFNPNKVQAYRLIGYENRLLKDEDFNNDLKDAGEMGSGHTVTALYEIIPTGVNSSFAPKVDALKYQKPFNTQNNYDGNEMLTVKIRYKLPDQEVSKKMQLAINDSQKKNTSDNFRFAAALAEFGMLLRQSDFKQNSSFDQVISLAEGAMGRDKEGYRSEFLKLAKSTQLMAKDLLTIANRNDVTQPGKIK